MEKHLNILRKGEVLAVYINQFESDTNSSSRGNIINFWLKKLTHDLVSVSEKTMRVSYFTSAYGSQCRIARDFSICYKLLSNLYL